MNRKQIKYLFAAAAAELAALYGCILYYYIKAGQAPLAAGAVCLLVMVCSFIGSVYGSFSMKSFKENKSLMGMGATWIHRIVFLLLIILYGIGYIFL